METDLNITDKEKVILAQICDEMGSNQMEFDLLYQTFKEIKHQGKAFGMDIKKIASIGIPIYKELADLKTMEMSAVGKLVTDGSIPFEEIRNIFVKITSPGGVFNKNI